MTQSKFIPLVFLLGFMLLGNVLPAQTWLDLTMGTSVQDEYASSIALRHQFSTRFRAGIELQTSSARYRFIEARPIREGYSSMISLPMSLTIQDGKRIRMDLFGRLGARFQGVIDPDDNDMRDSMLNSAAAHVEPGMLITIKASERLHFLTGITFPIILQLQPGFIFENNVSAIRAGLSFKATDRTVLFAQAQTGPAFGASGDTHKYHWGVQAGMRINLSRKPANGALVVAPTF